MPDAIRVAVIDDHPLFLEGVVHTLQPITQVTLVFLEPQTAAARRILEQAPPGDVVELPLQLRPHLSAGVALAESLAAFEGAAALAVDARVAHALEFLATATGPRVLSRAAAAAGVSPSRLRALAFAQLDTPLTAWLAWRRLEKAGKAMAAGATLAEAATDAGFAADLEEEATLFGKFARVAEQIKERLPDFGQVAVHGTHTGGDLDD